MEKRKKKVSEVIGGLGMSAMDYSEYLKELVIKIIREHPEADMKGIYVSKDDNGYQCLVYERYMTDEELEQYNVRLKKLEEEVVASGILDE